MRFVFETISCECMFYIFHCGRGPYTFWAGPVLLWLRLVCSLGRAYFYICGLLYFGELTKLLLMVLCLNVFRYIWFQREGPRLMALHYLQIYYQLLVYDLL